MEKENQVKEKEVMQPIRMLSVVNLKKKCPGVHVEPVEEEDQLSRVCEDVHDGFRSSKT